jgi:hypothetical protein
LHAALPLEPIEDHDTTPDAERVELRRRVTLRRREGISTSPHDGEPMQPVLRGQAIGDEEALGAAHLSRLRVREALVRIQRGLEPIPKGKPTGGEAIDFARSTDRGQRVQRLGRDRLRISGRACGASELSIALDARIFSVRLEKGDSPVRTAERLERRIERGHRIEVIEQKDDSVVIGLVAGL